MTTKLDFKLYHKGLKRFLKGYEEAKKYFLGFANDFTDTQCFSLAFAEEPDDYLEIMLYTGRKDEAGKKIFESDHVYIEFEDYGKIKTADAIIIGNKAYCTCGCDMGFNIDTKEMKKVKKTGSNPEKYFEIKKRLIHNRLLDFL